MDDKRTAAPVQNPGKCPKMRDRVDDGATTSVGQPWKPLTQVVTHEFWIYYARPTRLGFQVFQCFSFTGTRNSRDNDERGDQISIMLDAVWSRALVSVSCGGVLSQYHCGMVATSVGGVVLAATDGTIIGIIIVWTNCTVCGITGLLDFVVVTSTGGLAGSRLCFVEELLAFPSPEHVFDLFDVRAKSHDDPP